MCNYCLLFNNHSILSVSGLTHSKSLRERRRDGVKAVFFLFPVLTLLSLQNLITSFHLVGKSLRRECAHICILVCLSLRRKSIHCAVCIYVGVCLHPKQLALILNVSADLAQVSEGVPPRKEAPANDLFSSMTLYINSTQQT